MQYNRKKEKVFTKKKWFTFHRAELGHPHGSRVFVLGRQFGALWRHVKTLYISLNYGKVIKVAIKCQRL